MTKILEGTAALFLLISGAFYRYDYDITALVFFCLVIVLSLASLFSIRRDINKTKAKEGKKEINIHEFTFIDPPGYYKHPKYSHPICPFCLIKNKSVSPVSQIDKNLWLCNVCKQPTSGSKGDVFISDD